MTTTIKTCFKCNQDKPASEFYAHKAMKDGLLGKCKKCTRSDTRKNRADRIDYYRDYDKHRAMQPHRVAQRLAYQQSEQGKMVIKRNKERWARDNPIKRAAQIRLGNAVRDKKVFKPERCESCGAGGRIHGHHDDYSKPLEVRWLCPVCHSAWHKEHGEAKNGKAA